MAMEERLMMKEEEDEKKLYLPQNYPYMLFAVEFCGRALAAPSPRDIVASGEVANDD